MKIQIVQAEIEEAIRNYIGEQISIKEGMKIEIDLRSTRGDAGFTADIDITPAGKPTPPSGTSSTKPTTAPATESTKKEDPAPKGDPDPKAQAEDLNQGNEQSPATSPASDASTGGAAAAEAGTAQNAGDEPQQAATGEGELGQQEKPAARSLFKNLNRVSNAA
ncbi:hypothetical protein [Caballeronia sp. LZ034LL]|uniref:hypothetical protein n=1 Tax=Caballeronia sp. LZ034LL TaxID=3038567 RepID=UPI00285C0DC5|nr:hypothetical protein [Caballeronia sp. LZ034LL]MDR5839311.1 hypothetical protein [Caballeronia sp. LZ034LL]